MFAVVGAVTPRRRERRASASVANIRGCKTAKMT